MVKIVDIQEDYSIIFLSDISENIKKRINVIAQDCGWHYNDKSNAVYVFYFKYSSKDISKDKEREILQLIERYPENITSYLRMDTYKDYAEIYDVCTALVYRKLSYMKKIFASIFKNYKYVIWLGVRVSDLYRDVLLNFYMKLGFTFEKYRNVTYSGHVLNFVFIGLTYTSTQISSPKIKNKNIDKPISPRDKIRKSKDNKPKSPRDKISKSKEQPISPRNKEQPISPRNKEQPISPRDKLRKSPRDVKEKNIDWDMVDNLTFNKDIIIKGELLKKIYNNYSLGKITEYGGTFKLENNVLEEAIHVRGRELDVNVPNGIFTWHTHPAICYTKMGCYIGWPSGADMSFIFFKYLFGLLLHFVITEEGVYIIRLTKEMMKFVHVISWNQTWLQNITDLISERFTHLERYRLYPDLHMLERGGINQSNIKSKDSLYHLFSNTPDKKKYIEKFLNVANTFPLPDYIATNNNVNFINGSEIDGVKAAMDYYVKQTGNSLSFPVFKCEYISSYTQIQDRKLNLNFILSPEKIIL